MWTFELCPDAPDILAEHDRVLELIGGDNADEAAEAMRAHLLNTARLLVGRESIEGSG